MADFLIGHPNTMGQDSPDDANENYWNYGLFVQDDWRVMPRLTLNLGLRYDVQTAPTDTQRRIALFEPGVQSTVSPNAMLGQLFPGDPGVPDGGVDTNYNHFSPRVGFAYDASRKWPHRLPRRSRTILRHHLWQRVDAVAELSAVRRSRDQRVHTRCQHAAYLLDRLPGLRRLRLTFSLSLRQSQSKIRLSRIAGLYAEGNALAL